MADNPSTPLFEDGHRVSLMEELYRRYGGAAVGPGAARQLLRFCWKKYSWLVIVGGATKA